MDTKITIYIYITIYIMRSTSLVGAFLETILRPTRSGEGRPSECERAEAGGGGVPHPASLRSATLTANGGIGACCRATSRHSARCNVIYEGNVIYGGGRHL